MIGIIKKIYRTLLTVSIRQLPTLAKLMARLLGHNWIYSAEYYESTVSKRVEATAEIDVSDRTSMVALRICDAVVRNIYAGNPGKLAAWISASHVERG